MPLQATSGAASYDGFGGGVVAEPNYIESVFSTYLYTGNGSTQTITNGIDLSTKGGLVWIKKRNSSTYGGHLLVNTANGTSTSLSSNITNSSDSLTGFTSFNTNGFSMSGACYTYLYNANENSSTYASWTFRKQPKFFDVVTYTGDGTNNRAISHSLGSAPGFIIIKNVTNSQSWLCYHRSIGVGNYIILNSTGGSGADSNAFPSITSTTFVPTANESLFSLNASGNTYVAYLFAHNAGGFGLTGTDNVISCGSFTTDATTGNATVNLGFEPQWILTKMADGLSDWTIYDNMRGMSLTNSYELFPNSSSSEVNYGSPDIFPSSTGFSISYVSGSGQYGKNKNIIYIAIRRGPMKVPTSGTKVFTPVKATFSGTTVTDTGYVVDMVINKTGVATGDNNFVLDRLRGSNNSTGQITLPSTSSTSAEVASAGRTAFTGSVTIQNGFLQQDTTANNIVWAFGRAPSFFDEVCYTGTGTNPTVLNHNLGVAPEFLLIKNRSNIGGWVAQYGPGLGSSIGGLLNSTAVLNGAGNYAGSTVQNSTQISINSANAIVNASGNTYVMYLFASCPGVSKVGSYTGNGSTQTINCGFTGGARFVLLKATSTTGNWMVWDTARGIVSANDPVLALNATWAEDTLNDDIDPASVGFIVNNAGNSMNVSGGTYIYLAIA